MVNWGAPNKFYLNDQNDQNWLKVKAIGSSSNRDAIGAKIKLISGDKLLAVREVSSATGFCAQQPLVQHFGAKADQSYTVKVSFPGGAEVIRENVSAGQTLKIEEPK